MTQASLSVFPTVRHRGGGGTGRPFPRYSRLLIVHHWRAPQGGRRSGPLVLVERAGPAPAVQGGREGLLRGIVLKI